ncbi:hypothetical protein HPB47_005275, partial [Ixodes persulcatus]
AVVETRQRPLQWFGISDDRITGALEMCRSVTTIAGSKNCFGVTAMAIPGTKFDPDILREPGWKTIRSRIAATTATSATTTPAADPTKPQQKRRQLRKKPTTPPEDPLPPDDFKVVIRPQGGLDLSKTNAAQLADCIFHQTKITDFAQDQVRINTRSNFIVVSTPDERRAQQYMNLNAITWNATHYPVQSHIPPPSITTSGAIFQIPAEDSEPLIMESLTRHNPTITVIDARRIKDTGIVQVLFLGPHVPFWVRYRAVILRCYPYKRKTEACMACWSAGHRRDVCPKPSPKPHCTICGTLGPTPNHPCQPHCILCGQDHLTGAAGCPKRFQPRRTLPKILPNIPPTTPGTGPDRTTTTFTTPGLTYSQAAQGQLPKQPSGGASSDAGRVVLPKQPSGGASSGSGRVVAGSATYPVAVSSSLINPEAPSYVAVEGDLEAASPAEAVLVAFCL